MREPVDHLTVKRCERATGVHDQHQADQALAVFQVGLDQALPLAPNLFRHGGVAVARQVDEQRAGIETEEIDELRAPRRLRDEGEPHMAHERVDRARFAGIRAPRERDLRACGRRQARGLGD